MRYFAILVLTFAVLSLVGAGWASQTDGQANYNTGQLYQEVRQIVRRHYPEATAHRLDGKIHFEHDTRIFVIHHALKTGEWQDPSEERGPKKDGIYGDIELRQGRWQGAARVPQSFDLRYFTEYLVVPYSEQLDAHLVVRIKYPRQAPEGFLKELTDVLNRFDQYVAQDSD